MTVRQIFALIQEHGRTRRRPNRTESALGPDYQGKADLLISKLNQPRLIHHNLIPMGRAVLEPLRQREPLARHLVPVVRIHELVVVHAVGRVPLHPLHRRAAAVQLQDVIYETLAGRRERQRFRWVRLVVFCWVGLAHLEVLAGGGRGDFGGCDVGCVGCGGHLLKWWKGGNVVWRYEV